MLVRAHQELYEEALGLALALDLALAQRVAEAPRDPELRRLLWQRLVRHEVGQKQDLRLALAALQGGAGAGAGAALLSLEEVLRFVPDSAQISAFAPELCLALEESNRRVLTLKGALAEAERQVAVLRAEVRAAPLVAAEAAQLLGPDRLCDLSLLPLHGRAHEALLYPDGSCFLASSLQEELMWHAHPPGPPSAHPPHPFYQPAFLDSLSLPFAERDPEERASWAL